MLASKQVSPTRGDEKEDGEGSVEMIKGFEEPIGVAVPVGTSLLRHMIHVARPRSYSSDPIRTASEEALSQSLQEKADFDTRRSRASSIFEVG